MNWIWTCLIYRNGWPKTFSSFNNMDGFCFEFTYFIGFWYLPIIWLQGYYIVTNTLIQIAWIECQWMCFPSMLNVWYWWGDRNWDCWFEWWVKIASKICKVDACDCTLCKRFFYTDNWQFWITFMHEICYRCVIGISFFFHIESSSEWLRLNLSASITHTYRLFFTRKKKRFTEIWYFNVRCSGIFFFIEILCKLDWITTKEVQIQ